MTARLRLLLMIAAAGATALPLRAAEPLPIEDISLESGPSAGASDPYLVSDIDPGPKGDSSNPSGLLSLGQIVLFRARAQEKDFDIWRTDGSEGGTYPVTSCTGSCSPAVVPPFIRADRRAFFWVQWPLWALWVTDGTPSGTRAVLSGIEPAGPAVWVAEAEKLYFVGRDAQHGDELWVSDGTTAGTHQVRDLRPGAESSAPSLLTSFKGSCVFLGSHASGKFALWRTDGTSRGTTLLAGPWAKGAFFSSWLTSTKSRFYFQASTPRKGSELWVSDGTVNGTKVLDLIPGPSSAFITSTFGGGSSLFFALARGGKEELWSSEGTSQSTRRFSSTTFSQIILSEATPLGPRTIFMADDGFHGLEPWAADLVTRTVSQLGDVCPESCRGFSSSLGLVGGKLLLAGRGQRGSELWLTDGTASGTRMLHDFCPEAIPLPDCPTSVVTFAPLPRRLLLLTASEYIKNLWTVTWTRAGDVSVAKLESIDSTVARSLSQAAVAGSAAVFPARDELHGQELWSTDGTAAGTKLLRDIATGDLGGSMPSMFRAAGSTLSFLADDGVHGNELWRSDGTEAGTRLVDDLVPGPGSPSIQPNKTATLGENLFFVWEPDDSSDPFGGLWVSNGAAAGTKRLAPAGFLSSLAAASDRVLFGGYDDAHGTEPWISMGTPTGTTLLKDISPGSAPSYPRNIVAAGQRFFFTAENEEVGRELWVSDGTPQGTQLVVDLTPGEEGSDFGPLEPTGDHLLFIRHPQYAISELWRTDGSPAGTKLLGTFEAPYFPIPRPIVPIGEGAVVFAHDAIWASNGQPGGLRLVGSAIAENSTPRLYKGHIYFAGLAASALALWRTDGTPAGTAPVKDRDGNPIYLPKAFEVFDSRLFFVANVGDGEGLWMSDGTASPQAIRRLATRNSSGSSWPVLAVGNRLYFLGWDRDHGWELWALKGAPNTR